MGENAIVLEGVCKSYRKGWRQEYFHAIRDIDLKVGYGESVGFIGHNGAGKSSTIRIVMGLQKPTSGVAKLRGGLPDIPESRRRVAYVPENPLLYDYLTPLELLRIGAKLHGVVPNIQEKRCRYWLDRFGLGGAAKKRIRQFSKGMTQRAALAYAMVCDPEILILDEPLSGLDPLGRKEVVEILQEYRENGGTMLFSSHILTDVERLADRFVFIHRGNIRDHGYPGREMDDMYEVLIMESAEMLQEGFSRNYGSQMVKMVEGKALPQLLKTLAERQVRLLSVLPWNSLERTYVRLVKSAEDEGK